jgi:5'-phosphate synthase pdxT subunit
MTIPKHITIGVLALQGAFAEHISHLAEATRSDYPLYQFSFPQVRTTADLLHCDALIIPGGESTAMSLIAERTGLMAPLMELVSSGKPIWGTCAGLIFLAKELVNGKRDQKLLGGMDIQVKRNAFGRQQDSFEAVLDFSSFMDPAVSSFPGIFIRAPVISKILSTDAKSVLPSQENTLKDSSIIFSTNDYVNGSPVEILHQLDSGLIVAVRQGNKLGTSFHPELSSNFYFHKWFIDEFVLAGIDF